MGSSTKMNETHLKAIAEMEKEVEAGKHQLMKESTRCCIINLCEDTITIRETKDWSGNVLGDCPPEINVKQSAKFMHQGDDGVMGAVVYVGPRKKGGPTECAWVFAWYTPGNGNANKTYVEVGPAEDYPIGEINRWETIKANLLKAPGNTSHAIDPKTGAEASSSITPGNKSVAIAVFDIVKFK